MSAGGNVEPRRIFPGRRRRAGKAHIFLPGSSGPTLVSFPVLERGRDPNKTSVRVRVSGAPRKAGSAGRFQMLSARGWGRKQSQESNDDGWARTCGEISIAISSAGIRPAIRHDADRPRGRLPDHDLRSFHLPPACAHRRRRRTSRSRRSRQPQWLSHQRHLGSRADRARRWRSNPPGNARARFQRGAGHIAGPLSSDRLALLLRRVPRCLREGNGFVSSLRFDLAWDQSSGGRRNRRGVDSAVAPACRIRPTLTVADSG